jgi:toxin secretion/phage lysis holin
MIIIALGIMISADSILGVMRAIKFKVFSSGKFKRIAVKVVLYSITIIICTVIDTHVLCQFGVHFTITQYVIALLCLTEFFSCIENLSDLGVKIPYIYIFSKLKNSIPFIPNPRELSNKIDRLIDSTSESIPKNYKDIYEIWVKHTRLFTEENINAKCAKDDLSIIVDCQKKRLEALLMKDADYDKKIEKYIKYLLDLYTVNPPTTNDSLYILINKGVLFEFK